MRAYEMRPDGVTARVDDSAEDSMKHRSLTEEEGEMGGRAHRRSRIPRFRFLSNGGEHVIGPPSTTWRPARIDPPASAPSRRCGRMLAIPSQATRFSEAPTIVDARGGTRHGPHPHRVERDRDLLDPLRGGRRIVQDPVRSRGDALRRAATRSYRRYRDAAHQRPLPRGQRAAGVHRHRGWAHRRDRLSRQGPYRQDDRPRRPRGDPLPGGPDARYPEGTRGVRDVGPLRADDRGPDGDPDAASRPAQALCPVLAIARLDDPRTHDRRRRQLVA